MHWLVKAVPLRVVFPGCCLTLLRSPSQLGLHSQCTHDADWRPPKALVGGRCYSRGMMPWSTSCSRVLLCWSLNCRTRGQGERKTGWHLTLTHSRTTFTIFFQGAWKSKTVISEKDSPPWSAVKTHRLKGIDKTYGIFDITSFSHWNVNRPNDKWAFLITAGQAW